MRTSRTWYLAVAFWREIAASADVAIVPCGASSPGPLEQRLARKAEGRGLRYPGPGRRRSAAPWAASWPARTPVPAPARAGRARRLARRPETPGTEGWAGGRESTGPRRECWPRGRRPGCGPTERWQTGCGPTERWQTECGPTERWQTERWQTECGPTERWRTRPLPGGQPTRPTWPSGPAAPRKVTSRQTTYRTATYRTATYRKTADLKATSGTATRQRPGPGPGPQPRRRQRGAGRSGRRSARCASGSAGWGSRWSARAAEMCSSAGRAAGVRSDGAAGPCSGQIPPADAASRGP